MRGRLRVALGKLLSFLARLPGIVVAVVPLALLILIPLSSHSPGATAMELLKTILVWPVAVVIIAYGVHRHYHTQIGDLLTRLTNVDAFGFKASAQQSKDISTMPAPSNVESLLTKPGSASLVVENPSAGATAIVRAATLVEAKATVEAESVVNGSATKPLAQDISLPTSFKLPDAALIAELTKQRSKIEDLERQVAHWWLVSLSIFLAPRTQFVLRRLVSLPDGVALIDFDQLLLSLTGDFVGQQAMLELQAIKDALAGNDLIAFDGSRYMATPNGKLFVYFINNGHQLPPPRPQASGS